jgi:hypothetical protein
MKKRDIVIVLICTQFVMMLGSKVINLAVPVTAKYLDTGAASLQAVAIFYILVTVACMMAVGKTRNIWSRW